MRETVKIHPRVQRALDRIGVPEEEKFTPDPFQIEALERLEEGDVVVSAPTGSGKTWIATSAITTMLGKSRKVWYATPLKALSNILYSDFGQLYGPERVGILTGDRKENSGAPVIVGTTEILRNQLYDSMHRGEDLEVDLVVLDEAHFLGDEDRGMVWEEVMIYLPPRIRMLLLSATIENGDEIAAWLENIRSVPCSVVSSFQRPVPLFPIFLLPHGEVVPLKDRRALFPAVRRFEEQDRKQKRRFRREAVPYGRIIAQLREMDLLPAVFFLKSRSDCNKALFTCRSYSGIGRGGLEDLESAIEEQLEAYPFLKDHPQLRYIRSCRVAAHHAGQLPYWKLLVERLMKGGHLEAIFSTSTVAAGVNFPARTVVILQSDRFNGREFEDLTASELHQMLGRAGRRGMDHIGFAVVVPGPFMDASLISKLLDSPPDPVLSRMRVSFSMVLNLLLSHTPEDIKDLFERSFAIYQGTPEVSGMERSLTKVKGRLEDRLDTTRCGSMDSLLDAILRKREIDRSLQSLENQLERDRSLFSGLSHIKRGRLFIHSSSKVYCALEDADPDERKVRAAPLKRGLRIKRGQVKFRNLHLERIIEILDKRLNIPEDADAEQVAAIIGDAAGRKYRRLRRDAPLDPVFQEALQALEEKRQSLIEESGGLPCADCANTGLCFGKKDPQLARMLEQAVNLSRTVARYKKRLWKDFLRHFDFIVREKYAGEDGVLTEDGIWASQLRLDQPLMVAEGIRKNAFPDHSPEILTGLMALFVAEKSGDIEERPTIRPEERELWTACARMLEAVEPLRLKKEHAGFDTPPMPFWSALTLHRWTQGWPWEQLVEASGLDEGILATLIYRTADHLRQMVGLQKTHPALSRSAEQAVSIILRDPVAPF